MENKTCDHFSLKINFVHGSRSIYIPKFIVIPEKYQYVKARSENDRIIFEFFENKVKEGKKLTRKAGRGIYFYSVEISEILRTVEVIGIVIKERKLELLLRKEGSRDRRTDRTKTEVKSAKTPKGLRPTSSDTNLKDSLS